MHVGSRDLASLTTLRLGGPAGRLVTVTDPSEIAEAIPDDDPVLVLAGGSNVVIGDEGFPGTVVLLRTRGFEAVADPNSDGVRLTLAAGEPWDEVVARTVAEGWAGIECLSGVPGSSGATPIQNVGAYGQEVAETITSVRVYDRQLGQTTTFTPAQCGFGYRASVFKHVDRWVVLSVTLRLSRSGHSTPVRYPELARALEVPVGGRAPLAEVRSAVLRLRAGKGMVLDPDDPDTYSAGSFFTNPVLDAAGYAVLRRRAADLGEPPAWPGEDGTVKTSAAWLIGNAGFTKGYGRDGVAISGKHTLALTNRGAGTTDALLDLAREVRDGVQKRFEVELRPEPVLVNCSL
ncbi:UDP-N-acetylmuramate dehydrogenase [Rugosimonospora acidiphila]|uniref:UDP-N-acetylenolpyruvoylglucosamine reductase n=1 Tax=Rugosimonospora acidiphila TaxID=556531 RepID=A0ABP9RI58_9ACTN